jgi:Holliday junction resolvasome RuvABC ATP-dependent DNA helicase subunit
MADQKISEVLAKPDAALEMTLRPSLFSEFTGQLKVQERRSRQTAQGSH